VTDTLSLTVRSYWPSRAVVVRAGVVCVAFATWPGAVYAQGSSSRALDKARGAWDNADFDLAPALYETAIEVGGLQRSDVVDAYVRMGSALAINGKKKPALDAFRKAALIDPTFQLPPEAGKKAATLAKLAKRQQARTCSLSISLQVADEVDSGSPFGVDVTVSPPHPPLLDTLSFSARDSLAGYAYERTLPADASVHFDVPTRMTLPDATLVVQVKAHDTHDNELWVGEKRVHVAKPLPEPAPGADRSARTAPATAAPPRGGATVLGLLAHRLAVHHRGRRSRRGRGRDMVRDAADGKRVCGLPPGEAGLGSLRRKVRAAR
jgi:hypothetical protein